MRKLVKRWRGKEETKGEVKRGERMTRKERLKGRTKKEMLKELRG